MPLVGLEGAEYLLTYAHIRDTSVNDITINSGVQKNL